MPVNPSVRTCTHVKVTGIKCGSPALRDERFCYFHQRMIRGVPTPPKQRIHPMALIENAEGIQAALIETINAIVRNTIDLKRAALILRALSIAAHNARRVRFDCFENDMVRAIPEYPAPAASAKSEVAEARPTGAEQSLPPATPKRTAHHAAQPEAPRKPPASVTSAPAEKAQAVNARHKRE